MNELFDLSKIQIISDSYIPTDQCYLSFEVTHEKDIRILALQVAEKKSDNTIILIDSVVERISGTYPVQMIKINEMVEFLKNKYNCIILN